MSKVLLVYDDFSELNELELSLKKVGFDIVGLTNEFSIRDQVISFNPDIVICNGVSTRVNSISIGKKLKEMTRWNGKTVLIIPKSYDVSAEEMSKVRMDMLLETPLAMTRLIQVIAKLLGQNDQAILEKLIKSFTSDKTENNQTQIKKEDPLKSDSQSKTNDPFAELISELSNDIIVKGSVQDQDKITINEASLKLNQELQAISAKSKERVSKYNQFLSGLKLYPESTITKVNAKKELNNLKKDWDNKELEDQDEERRKFVNLLFQSENDNKK